MNKNDYYVIDCDGAYLQWVNPHHAITHSVTSLHKALKFPSLLHANVYLLGIALQFKDTKYWEPLTYVDPYRPHLPPEIVGELSIKKLRAERIRTIRVNSL